MDYPPQFLDDVQEAIDDAVCNDEGRLRAATLLTRLNRRRMVIAGWSSARKAQNERLTETVPEQITQQEFDKKLERALSSPVPTLISLGAIAAFVFVVWLCT